MALKSMSLLEAASCGDLAEVKSLLNAYSTNPEDFDSDWLHSVDSKGYSSAAWACCQDDIDILTLLLSFSPSYFSICTHNGSTLLHLAALHKSMRCLVYLVSLSLDVPEMLNATNSFQETPLHMAAGAGNEQVVKKLLQAGANPTLQDQYGRSAPNVAKQNGYQGCYAVIMSFCTADQQALLKMEETVLERESATAAATMLSCSTDQSSKHKMLVDLRNKVCNVSLNKASPLERHIFSTACDIKEEDVKSEIPLTSASTPSDRTQACFASHNDYRDDQDLSSRTPLSKLVEFPGDVDRVRELLQDNHPSAVNPAGKDMFGVAAIHKFSSWNKVDLLELLIPHLSTEDLNVPGGMEGFTCLHYCVDMQASAALEFLKKLPNINLHAKDKIGRTYNDLATELGHKSML